MPVAQHGSLDRLGDLLHPFRGLGAVGALHRLLL
jgi:hypothetical protein